MGLLSGLSVWIVLIAYALLVVEVGVLVASCLLSAGLTDCCLVFCFNWLLVCFNSVVCIPLIVPLLFGLLIGGVCFVYGLIGFCDC